MEKAVTASPDGEILLTDPDARAMASAGTGTAVVGYNSRRRWMVGSMDGLALRMWAARRWPSLRFIIVSGGVTPVIADLPAGATLSQNPNQRTSI